MSVTVEEALNTATKWLSDAGVEGAARDAQILLAHAMECEPSRLILMHDEEVLPEIFHKFDTLLAAREKFQPVSQIIGGREFWGRWFNVTRDVLDPRPETESLIDIALKAGPFARVLDLGTGTGILAVTLMAEWPDSRAIAVDISPEAILIATANAKAHKVSDRVMCVNSNWYDAVTGKFDLVVSNPPYIAMTEMAELSPDVLNWEPMMALTPGGDGLGSYRVIASELADYLDEGGLGLFEIGHSQGADVVKIFTDAGFKNVTVSKDMNGHDRVVAVKN